MRIQDPNNRFIITLPFPYRKAVLTQARTHKDGICPFIIEFNDGSRKFMKGPYRELEKAKKPVICNEIKRMLLSDFLHPIECEIREYDTGEFFLVCEELGKADLDNIEKAETKMDGIFEVLKYGFDRDFVSNPFEYNMEINEKNKNVWVQIIVNYCFRWVFGIGDPARRNLMLQRSAGKIFSVDEASIDSVEHKSIWNNRSPGKDVNSLVQQFVKDEELLKIVIDEVRRWRLILRGICFDFGLNSINIEKRIDNFLHYPERVLVFVSNVERSKIKLL